MLWGLAALGLLLALILTGQRAITLLQKSKSFASPDAADSSVALAPNLVQSPPLSIEKANAQGRLSRSASVEVPTPFGLSSQQPTELANAAATLSPFQDAIARHDNGGIVKFGTELAARGLARPSDLARIAVALYVIGDCTSAQGWITKATAAYARDGTAISPALERAEDHCAGKRPESHVQRTTEGSGSGDRDVSAGELYYGFADYSHAIDALERGLSKGPGWHADDAYVYLGLSQLALGHYAESCAAFDQLEQLPNLSPRIRKLWMTYADMHCMVVDSEP